MANKKGKGAYIIWICIDGSNGASEKQVKALHFVTYKFNGIKTKTATLLHLNRTNTSHQIQLKKKWMRSRIMEAYDKNTWKLKGATNRAQPQPQPHPQSNSKVIILIK